MDATYDLFVSYKTENANLVRAFAERLLAAGLRVWFAEYQIPPEIFDDPAAIQRAIDAGIRGARFAVAFTNDRWADSRYCRLEIEQILAQLDRRHILEVQTPPQAKPHRHWPALAEVPSVVCPDEPADAVRALDGLGWFDRPAAGAAAAPAAPATQRRLRYGVRLRVGPLRAKGLGALAWADLDARSRAMGERYCFEGEITGRPVSLNININPYFSILHTAEYPQTAALDDREVYRTLRLLAARWMTGQGQRCRGVHLFFHGGRSCFCASAADENLTGDLRFWERRYVLPLRQVEGRGVEVQIAFAVALPADDAAALPEFARLAPFFDSVVQSITAERPRPHVNGELARHVAARAVLLGFAGALRYLTTWPQVTGEYGLVSTAIADVLLGALAVDAAVGLASPKARIEADALGLGFAQRFRPLAGRAVAQVWNLVTGGAFLFAFYLGLGVVMAATLGLPVLAVLAGLFALGVLPPFAEVAAQPAAWLLAGAAVYGLGYWAGWAQTRQQGAEFIFLDRIKLRFSRPDAPG